MLNISKLRPTRPAVAALAVAAVAATLSPLSAAAVPLRPGRLEPKREVTADRALPVARRWLSAADLRRPHHDHPAIDIDLPVGTRVVAIQPGRVRAVLGDSGCGRGIVVDGSDGLTYTYCHASRLDVRAGQRLDAGDRVMLSGISGSAENAHLHLEIEDARGRLLCPQPVLSSWWRGGAMPPRRAPYRGCVG